MEIPEAMIKQQALQMADGYDRNLKQQGLSLEQYVKMMGMDIYKVLLLMVIIFITLLLMEIIHKLKLSAVIH